MNGDTELVPEPVPRDGHFILLALNDGPFLAASLYCFCVWDAHTPMRTSRRDLGRIP